MTTFSTSETQEARMWDSEKRDSPYSTVCDPNDDTYCEGCDSEVDYSDGSVHGKCKCDEGQGTDSVSCQHDTDEARRGFCVECAERDAPGPSREER